MDTPGRVGGMITLRDVMLGEEQHLLDAALRREFVLGYSEADWQVAVSIYTKPPYVSAATAARRTRELVSWALKQQEK